MYKTFTIPTAKFSYVIHGNFAFIQFIQPI